MSTYLSDSVMHTQAADLYEQSFDIEPGSLLERLEEMSPHEIYMLLVESLTENEMSDEAFKTTYMGLAEEAAAYDQPSAGFNTRAGELLFPALKWALETFE